jgi:hypothetical protein
MTSESVGTGAAAQPPRWRAAARSVLFTAAACAVAVWAGAKIWRERTTTDSTRRLREALEQLQSESADERTAAAGSLRFAASRDDIDAAILGLKRAIVDQDAEVRTTAAQSFGWLVESLSKLNDDVGSRAVIAMWTDQASRALVQSASDQEASVRASVLLALAATAQQPGCRGRNVDDVTATGSRNIVEAPGLAVEGRPRESSREWLGKLEQGYRPALLRLLPRSAAR